MKPLLILILSLSIVLIACQHHPKDGVGFTNKAEAKNQTVNGKKEGKWIEYLDAKGDFTMDTNKAKFYFLTIYSEGEVVGIARLYYKSGNLFQESHLINGKEDDGLHKTYYENGQVKSETPYINGVPEGDERDYTYDGHIEGIITYKNGKIVTSTIYDYPAPK